MPSGFMDASTRKKSELDYPHFWDIEDGLISYTCYRYVGCSFCNLTICGVQPNYVLDGMYITFLMFGTTSASSQPEPGFIRRRALRNRLWTDAV